MSNQYEVLGKAPSPEELKKLSTNDNHVTIKKLSGVEKVVSAIKIEDNIN